MKVIVSILFTLIIRPTIMMAVCYDSSVKPSLPLWFPLQLGVYPIVLDFWFYWYHRLMHEVDFLWRYHRTHHLTKHPNPLLTLYADLEQELFDIAGIPLLAYFSLRLMGFPMGFYDWWIGHQYVVFAELAGHSGLRLYAVPPNTLSWPLRMVHGELIIEDHDLHHRRGWKRSYNYGKQTRLWDRIFGTCGPRIECYDANIDAEKKIDMPLF